MKFPLLSFSHFCSNTTKCTFEASSLTAVLLKEKKQWLFLMSYTITQHSLSYTLMLY